MGLFDGISDLELVKDEESFIHNKIVESYYDGRKLILNGDITDAALEEVCLPILGWNHEDKPLPVGSRTPIILFVNSCGGDAIMGLGIIDAIMSSETPVFTVGISQCSSMACYILMAGKRRYAFPHTVFLLHDGQSGYFSSANKGKDIQRFHNDLDDRLHQFLFERTRIDKEFFDKISDREYYLFADEAKELGIIDGVIGIDCGIGVLEGEA